MHLSDLSQVFKEAYSLRKMQDGDGVSAPIGQSWSEFGVMYLTLWYL